MRVGSHVTREISMRHHARAFLTLALDLTYLLLEIRFQCMGTWEDDDGNVWSGMADLGEDVYRERFRCMVRARITAAALYLINIS